MSSTQSPLPPPTTYQTNGEQEPLLGHRDSEDENVGAGLALNLISGTATIAQIGGVALVVGIWVSVFSNPLLLFSAHPLLNSVGVALLLESALLLQPTHTQKQKRYGAIVHSALNGTAFVLMYAALIVIILSKVQHHGYHFESAHAKLGLITYILLFIQATVGMVQFYFPGLLGGVDNAKAIYKYHRISGYLIFVFIIATAISVTYTPYVANVLKLSTSFVAATSALVLIGVLPRVKLHKLGITS